MKGQPIATRYLLLSGTPLLVAVGWQLTAPFTDPAEWRPQSVLLLGLLTIVPAFLGGFANALVPPLIGTQQMAFPKAGGIAFWLLAAADAFGTVAFFQGASISLSMSLALAGTTTLILSLNLLITIIAMRAPKLGMNRLPLLVWLLLITGCVVLLFVPVFAAAVTVMGLRAVDWALLHPLSYVMLLPAIGIIAEVARPSVAAAPVDRMHSCYGTLAIVLVGLMVWMHRTFTAWAIDESLATQWLAVGCAAMSVLAAMPMVRRWQRIEAAQLWAGGSLFLFITGIAADVMLLRTHTPRAFSHFLFVLSVGATFAGFAALYRWSAQILGHCLPESWGRAQFATALVGVSLSLLPAHLLPVVLPLPEPIIDLAHTIGRVLLGLSMFALVCGVRRALISGGATVDTLDEWMAIPDADYRSV